MHDNSSSARKHKARVQRVRRARMKRVDYFPSPDALKAIEAKKAKERPGSEAATNSAAINAIVTAWARQAGLLPILSVPCAQARANDSNHERPEFLPVSRARAGAYESHSSSGIKRPVRAPARAPASDSGEKQRVVCAARRHRDGHPCEAKSEPGKRRCRFHGGRSTGPRTPVGKARALLNLRRGRHGA